MESRGVLFLSLNGALNDKLRASLQSADLVYDEVQAIDAAREIIASGVMKVVVIRTDRVGEPLHDLTIFSREQAPSTKVIVNPVNAGVEDAVRFIKEGAYDVIVSESDDARIIEGILRATANYREVSPKNGAPLTSPGQDAVLVGQSPAICEIRSAVNLVAKSNTNVLITGESGTGKEVVARMIHQQSHRPHNAYVTINCAALPHDVIENELFGHEKGAFTGALLKKMGCFELATGGTLFLDEIAEMSMETQAKLLRVIETGKFRRLGGKEEVHVDVRLIAATNKHITEALQAKELREDLYYRVSVIEIFITPLRERKEDIGLLVEYFLRMFAQKYGKSQQGFSDEAYEHLISYEWPGNVREVRNVTERAVVICSHETISSQYLPPRLLSSTPVKPHITIPLGCSTQEAERILILETLASAGNNKAKAARILGMSRKTLHNKLSGFSAS